jgi:hypothetical protein
MVRWIAAIGMVALIGSAWLLFEVGNIWPFNADRVAVLRSMFAFGLIATVLAFAFGRSRLLPPALMAVAFVSTTIYSNADITIAYIVSAVVIIASVGALGLFLRPPR